MVIVKKTRIAPRLLLFALVAWDLTFAASAPLALLTNPSCADGSNAWFTLEAWPGEFIIQTSTSLPGGWSNELQMSVGGERRATMVVPLQDRSQIFVRAVGVTPSDGAGCLAQFQTLGSTFEPDVRCASDPTEFLWIWSDGLTSSNRPIVIKDFGSPGARIQGLKIDPASAITSINLGFDGADGGSATPLDLRPSQNVGAVRFPYPLISLRYWASSYCPITNTLDFTGFTALETIECFRCTKLQRVVLTNLPSLKRVCLEECDLQELDLSGNPNLQDLRGAANSYTNIILGGGTGPLIFHWCVNENPQLTQRLADIMTNFFSLEELIMANDNQSGEFKVVSTNLTHLRVEYNHFTSADLTGQSKLWNCWLQGNALTNLIITGCSSIHDFDVHDNLLTTEALDAVLAELDVSALSLQRADLSGNPQYPSPVGYAHYTNLTARGAQVILDWPPTGNNEVPARPDANGIVTSSKRSAAWTNPTNNGCVTEAK